MTGENTSGTALAQNWILLLHQTRIFAQDHINRRLWRGDPGGVLPDSHDAYSIAARALADFCQENNHPPGSIRMPGETNAIIPNLTTPELKPHQAAYCTIHFSGQPTADGPGPGSPYGCGMNYLAGEPTGAVWRLTVSMQEQLTGLRLAAARLTHYADTRRSYATAGITNSPFSCLYLGKPTTVSSEEVTWSDQ